MRIMRDYSLLHLEDIMSLGLRSPSKVMFISIVVLFSVILISNFGLYGVDDILMVVQPSPSRAFEWWALLDGRYLLLVALRSARFIGIDFMRDYSVVALIYAISFAVFIVAVIDYLVRDVHVSPAERAIIGFLFATLFMTHGFQIDLIIWKNCFPFMLLIYVLMAASLAVLKSKRHSLWHYMVMVALFLALNCIYQPATMALFWLAVAWAIVTYVGSGEEARSHLHLIHHVAMVAAVVAVAGLGYIALTKVAALTGHRAGQRVSDLADSHILLWNLREHAKYVLALVDPTGSIYGPYAGGPIVFLVAILVALILRSALRRSWLQLLFVSALLGTMLICSQNFENILLRYYAPTGRSSFYAGLLFPVLWLAAWLGIRPRMGRTLLLIAVVAIALQTMIFAKVTAERFELQRRDFALAKDIGDAIRSDPSLAGLTGIKLPTPFYISKGYYRGLTRPIFDSGRSVLEYDFARVPLITFVTGLEVVASGTVNCGSSEPPGQVRVWRDGTDIVVCF